MTRQAIRHKYNKNKTKKRSQKKGCTAIAAVCSLAMAGSGMAEAATITVNMPSCSLIDAINAANTDAVSAGCSAGSGADTIILPENSTITLDDIDNMTYGSSGTPVITSEVTIQGNNSVIERSNETGTPEFGIFSVGQAGSLTINNATMRNGSCITYTSPPLLKTDFNFLKEKPEITQSILKKKLFAKGASALSMSGGGITNLGNLTINHCTISGNTALFGGGILGANGTITINDSKISNNAALDYGGGLFIYSGSTTINNSTISGNNATRAGGGILENNGTTTISNSTISGNTAIFGSGIMGMFYGNTTINNCTISDNTAPPGAGGGGIMNALYHSIQLTNSTISGNNAPRGGGIFNYSQNGMSLTFCTVAHNSATIAGGGIYNAIGTVDITGTIVAGNQNNDCTNYYYAGAVYPAIISDNGHNWFGDDTCDGTAQGDPLLGPLEDNGGLTSTHALLDGSGAIDAADACALATDQRGISRPQGTACDIGAFELARAAKPEIAGVPAPAMSLGGLFALITGLFGAGLWGRRQKKNN